MMIVNSIDKDVQDEHKISLYHGANEMTTWKLGLVACEDLKCKAFVDNITFNDMKVKESQHEALVHVSRLNIQKKMINCRVKYNAACF